jgi:uncharacterized protein
VKPEVNLLILQSTSFCNLDCGYCYLPDRHLRRNMPVDIARQAARRVAESELVGDQLTVVWHAGEPTSIGLDYYKEAIAAINAELPDSVKVEHNFQTNATLLDDDWIAFLQTDGISVGVSVDGPQEIHDSFRRYRNGRGTFSKTYEGIQMLKAAGIPFSVIAVVTAASIHRPREMFDFFCEIQPRSLGFNIEEVEGIHTESSIKEEHLGAVAEFYRTFLRLNAEAGEPLRLREFESVKGRLVAPAMEGANVLNSMARPFGHVTVNAEGGVSTFSPELLSATSNQYNDFVFGNVNSQSLLEMLKSPKFRQVYADICAGNARCASECAYFRYCGGGAPSSKLAEHGTFAETMYCRTEVKIPIDVYSEFMLED